jgi:hypothetical protein
MAAAYLALALGLMTWQVLFLARRFGDPSAAVGA